MDGLLIIDKPEGPTSHDVVARIRRAFNESRVGHTGTLDPMATGVLPIVLGRATRLARFLSSATKRYRATLRIGVATDTYDRLGEPVGAPADVSGITADIVERALTPFRGTFVQTPPVYSAKKLGGVASHRLARRGDAVTPAAVPVTVDRLTLVSVDADLIVLDVVSSAGFYVRSLAHDLGQALGCGAHLTALRRTASGELDEADSVPLELCQQDPDAARARVQPMRALLTWAPAAIIRDAARARVPQGQALRPEDVLSVDAGIRPLVERQADGREQTFVRILDERGELLALAAGNIADGNVTGGEAGAASADEAPDVAARGMASGRSASGRLGAVAAVRGLLHPRIVLV